jgi:hypothetical protein
MKLFPGFFSGQNAIYACLTDDLGNCYHPGSLPGTAIQLTSSSGNVANATATATLAGTSGKTTYIQGFTVSGSGSTLGLPVTVTVTGTVSGTLHFTYTAGIGVLVGNQPLIINFPISIAASAQNTSIVVSCPALGSGNTNNTVIAYGYQL